MNKLLKCLYDCFYNPPEFSEQKQEVEECHQALIQVLEKPERRLVLRIMDAQSLMAEERSIDSFISGFELAWQLSMELNQYEKERSVSRCTAKRSGALSMSGKEEATRENESSLSQWSPPVWPCVPLYGHRTNQPGIHPRCPCQPLQSPYSPKFRR